MDVIENQSIIYGIFLWFCLFKTLLYLLQDTNAGQNIGMSTLSGAKMIPKIQPK